MSVPMALVWAVSAAFFLLVEEVGVGLVLKKTNGSMDESHGGEFTSGSCWLWPRRSRSIGRGTGFRSRALRELTANLQCYPQQEKLSRRVRRGPRQVRREGPRVILELSCSHRFVLTPPAM